MNEPFLSHLFSGSPVYCDKLDPSCLQHLAVVHRLVDIVKDPNLAGDGDIVLVMSRLDHLAQKFPFVLKEGAEMATSSNDLESRLA